MREMEITKRYAPSKINFHLLPAQMERIKTSLQDYHQTKGQIAYNFYERFLIDTNSQTLETNSYEEFKEILRSLSEEYIIALRAELGMSSNLVYLMSAMGSEPVQQPPAFKLTYQQESVEIILTQNSFENLISLFTIIEEEFSLEIVKPKTIINLSPKRTAFVAHSFDQIGRSYAYELIQFLNLIQFKVETGDRFSPESIAKKVKRRLKAQEIVIAIISKKEDYVWLTQETTGATVLEKPLFILIEEGVEFKAGIHSDLEFIKFPPENISTTFTPILQGLQELGYTFQ